MTLILSQLKSDYRALKSKLKYSYFEAFLSSFVVGIAESFFAAFSIEKGMSTIQSGMLLSLPLILAVGANLLFNFYMRHRSISQQVQRNTLLQTLSLVGLILFSLTDVSQSVLVFGSLMILYSVYWYGFFSSQPVWNIWISELITDSEGHEYFALRTRLTQIGIIIGLVLGGALFQWKFLNLTPTHLFGLLFSAAFVGQLFKYYSFKKHVPSNSVMSFSFNKVKHIFNQNRSFFSTYGLFNASLFLSSPYVTGYLLTSRNLNYFDFMVVTVCLFIGKITSTYVLSLYAKKLTPIKLMVIGGLIAAPLPLLWPYCETLQAMYLLNFVSGMFWALWDVGLSLSFFKNISAEDKIETVTLY
ncbi:MAG: hypothetical protein H7Z71_09440, partial [Moraxellaceae bacterium]|nr:hypothetical protein [Pseudobdellovibrionaceae bacterium]